MFWNPIRFHSPVHKHGRHVQDHCYGLIKQFIYSTQTIYDLTKYSVRIHASIFLRRLEQSVSVSWFRVLWQYVEKIIKIESVTKLNFVIIIMEFPIRSLFHPLWVFHMSAFFHWSQSDSKSAQVPRIFLSIIAKFVNAVVWMVTIPPLISCSPSLEIRRRIETFQMIAMLRYARILWRVLET